MGETDDVRRNTQVEQKPMDRSTVSGNTADRSGGGIVNGGGTLTLTNSRVRDNAPDNCAPPHTVPGCTG
ncbi:hypothetical protein ACFZA1_21540 [Streptomyces filipinensis]|uniref:hypothetical protein n=1 Tax=Streptomyces filipinensis TaxID=66887 RepID=UPI0036E6A48D